MVSSAKKAAYNDAAEKFKSPTHLAAERFGSRSPPPIPESRSSSSPTFQKTPEQPMSDPGKVEIMSQMSAATSVVVKGRKSPAPPKRDSPDQVSSALDRANAALATASGVAQLADASPVAPPKLSSTTGDSLAPWAKDSGLVSKSVASTSSSRSAGSKDLDMKHNDNAFHVVANLIVDRFQSRMTGGTTLEVTESDWAYLHQTLQPSVRKHFVEALRYRLQHNCPPDSEAHIHFLTRQCRDLGLDREGDNNPLLANPTHEKRIITITNLAPTMAKAQSTAIDASQSLGRSTPRKQAQAPVNAGPANTPAGRPPQHRSTATNCVLSMEEENQVLRGQLEEQRKQLRQSHEDQKTRLLVSTSPLTSRGGLDDNSVTDSTLTGSTGVQSSSTETLARQQLMAELREASNLMAESKTPEAAQFWRQHVVELQARLRALHGEGGGSASVTPTAGPRTPRASKQRQPRGPSPLIQATGESLEAANNYQLADFERTTPKMENIYEQTSMVPPAVEQSDRSVQATKGEGALPMVDVISPADLPGGYHFEAEIDGQRFLATVPEGGVEKGETFSCVMRDLETVGAETPVGRWRDRLSDFTVHGIFHPAVLNALFCPLIAVGQIMTRVEIDWLARRPKDDVSVSSPFHTMGIIVGFWAIMNLLIFAAFNYKWSAGLELSAPDIVALAFLNGAMLIFCIYSTAMTRQTIREKYVIREQRCYDLEDCCCATFCMPCTICQMSRHTANYKEYDASCCSTTGLSDEVPVKPKPFAGYAA